MKNVPKSSKIFHCKKCDYITSRKSQWKRHLETKKHILNTLNKIRTQKVPKCACGKTYKSRSGLYYHQKKCAYTVEKLEEKEITIKEDSMEEKLLKEIRDLKEEMKNIKINQTINNQKININVFLNEHCKNAMSLEDFVNKLQLTLHDVAKTTELGFAGGLSNILITPMVLSYGSSADLGIVQSITDLPVDMYSLKIKVTNLYGISITSSFQLSVQEITRPEWIVSPMDLILKDGEMLDYGLIVADDSGI